MKIEGFNVGMRYAIEDIEIAQEVIAGSIRVVNEKSDAAGIAIGKNAGDILALLEAIDEPEETMTGSSISSGLEEEPEEEETYEEIGIYNADDDDDIDEESEDEDIDYGTSDDVDELDYTLDNSEDEIEPDIEISLEATKNVYSTITEKDESEDIIDESDEEDDNTFDIDADDEDEDEDDLGIDGYFDDKPEKGEETAIVETVDLIDNTDDNDSDDFDKEDEEQDEDEDEDDFDYFSSSQTPVVDKSVDNVDKSKQPVIKDTTPAIVVAPVIEKKPVEARQQNVPVMQKPVQQVNKPIVKPVETPVIKQEEKNIQEKARQTTQPIKPSTDVQTKKQIKQPIQQAAQRPVQQAQKPIQQAERKIPPQVQTQPIRKPESAGGITQTLNNQVQKTQSATPQMRVPEKAPFQQAAQAQTNNIAKPDYSGMSVEKLFQSVRAFAIENKLNKAPIDPEILHREFGRDNIAKLVKKQYLLVKGSKYILGIGV